MTATALQSEVWEEIDERIDGGGPAGPVAVPAPPRLELLVAEKRGAERSGPEEDPPPAGFVYDGVAAGAAMRAGLSRRSAYARPLPMEEVTLYIKEIDNSGVRRAADPAGRNAFARMIGCGLIALFLLVLCFGPRAWLRHSGYRQAELAELRLELSQINHHLQVRHAQLSDLRRVVRMAAAQGLAEPPLERYTWQGRTIAEEPDDAALVNNLREESR